jgi:hypothetical protein
LIEAPDTFDHEGWLQIGFCGHQPSLGEGCISTDRPTFAPPLSCPSACLRTMNFGAANPCCQTMLFQGDLKNSWFGSLKDK